MLLQTGTNWVELKLVGGAKSPRDAVGTKAYLTAHGIISVAM